MSWQANNQVATSQKESGIAKNYLQVFQVVVKPQEIRGVGFIFFDFHHYPWGRWSNLTDVFHLGWNHQPAGLDGWIDCFFYFRVFAVGLPAIFARENMKIRMVTCGATWLWKGTVWVLRGKKIMYSSAVEVCHDPVFCITSSHKTT